MGCFNKGKLNQRLQFGRAFHLGRIGGNFLFVAQCTSIYMPDAQSMPGVIRLHEQLYGSGMLESIATDKGYYSYDNERLLLDKCVLDIQLPRPERTLKPQKKKRLGLPENCCMTDAQALNPLSVMPNTVVRWAEAG
ncbi:hypothetical protein SC610_00130 [Legionella pneumophila serogroup 1]